MTTGRRAFLLPVLVFCILLVAGIVAPCAAGAEALKLAVDPTVGELKVLYRGDAVLVYSFASNQFKPYVKELRSFSGENVLLDAPADHLHHHGLMYAVRINGTNFWEELADSGRQKHVRFLCHDAIGSDATFTELLHWVGPHNQEPLLIEERTLAVSVDPGNREVILRWTGRFTAAQQPVTLHGSGYNGLGMRLPKSWNGVAQHQNSEGLPYSPAHQWDVTPAKWAAVSHEVGGKLVSVVLFANPASAGETRFFSMNNPFTYLSATQNLDQEPLKYAPGERFEINYLLLLAEGRKNREDLNNRYVSWLAAPGAKGTFGHEKY